MTGPSAAARAFRPDADASYKLIYLARRRPDMAADAFPQAWREHSQLASSFGTSLGRHFRSVRQCVADRRVTPGAPFTDVYDGSSILAMRSWADLMAARYHPHALEALLADEKRVFAGPVDDWTMAVEESVLRDGDTRDHAILSFLAPRAEEGAETFAMRLDRGAARLCDAAPDAARFVRDRVVDPARAYPFAAVIEIWFADRDALVRTAGDPTFKTALTDIDDAAGRSVHLAARLNLAKANDAGGRWSETA